MSDNRSLVPVLAAAIHAGPWDRSAIERRLAKALGARSRRRAKRLLDELFAVVQTPYAPQLRQLERLIGKCPSLRAISERMAEHVLSLTVTRPPPRFGSIASLRTLDVPKITTQGDLARWLGIPLTQSDWLTDERRTIARSTESRLHHYSYRWTRKRSGGWRLIEAPKGRTKLYQRRILREILDRLPASPAAFAFVRGRNGAEAAAKHAGEAVVITVDLENFFLSVRSSRVHAAFRCLGYPAPVARMLTSLCTTSTPTTVLVGPSPGEPKPDRATCELYRARHLPQGAPTSPALANFAAHRLNARLAGLARVFGARYTRYADDLTFSGDAKFARQAVRFLRIVDEIARDENFRVNARKTRVMTRASRQTVTGLVVNDHINVPRRAYDQLKATLTNCVRNGPAGQNRDQHPDFRAHLDGRVAWVEAVNLRRGSKLRRLFNAIRW